MFSFTPHVVSKDGIMVNPNKIEAMVNWDRPINVSEVRIYSVLPLFEKYLVIYHFFEI